MSNEELTVTLRTILNSIEALNELINVPVPAKTSFGIRKIAQAVEDERAKVTESVQARRAELFKDGKTPSEDEMKELNAEIEELLNTEVTVKGQRVHVSELGTASVKPATLLALDWLVVD